jgi:hypothetical protein
MAKELYAAIRGGTEAEFSFSAVDEDLTKRYLSLF